MLEYYILKLAFCFAVVAVVWVELLEQDNILHFLTKYINKIPSEKIQHLLYCNKCFAGQLALWFTPVFIAEIEIRLFFFIWFLAVIFSIFISMIINRILR